VFGRLDGAVVHTSPHSVVRLQLQSLAYNLPTFPRCIELLEALADWSLNNLQHELIKISARAITFALAEVAVTGTMVRAILAAIRAIASAIAACDAEPARERTKAAGQVRPLR
jgi:hypothetical protein